LLAPDTRKPKWAKRASDGSREGRVTLGGFRVWPRGTSNTQVAT